MTIRTIRDNLICTIEGKKLLLASLEKQGGLAQGISAAFLRINLSELEAILRDVNEVIFLECK